jgi:hypothetical protein
MADTPVDICNRALQKVGASPIVSLNESSTSARACKAVYDSSRKALLRDHLWNFAKRRAILAADVTPPAFGKENSFQLPADYLIFAPPDPEMNSMERDWVVEGRKLLTNDSGPLYLPYISDVTDASLFDPLFSEALECKIAIQIAPKLTESNAKKADLKDDFNKAIARAKNRNAIEKVPVESAEDSWVTVRR